jgi:hypothetical protein
MARTWFIAQFSSQRAGRPTQKFPEDKRGRIDETSKQHEGEMGEDEPEVSTTQREVERCRIKTGTSLYRMTAARSRLMIHQYR